MADTTAPDVSRTQHLFETTFPGASLYDERDWARLKFASDLATGASVADFGTGPGALVYGLAESGKFSRITALDIATHSKALHHRNVSYRIADVRKPIPSDITRHDTVFCMEVIEHIEPGYNPQMLTSLRGLAALRLVVTVPYNEPEPLWWHDKPGGHRQRFTLEKIAQMFPSAFATIFPRWGVDWLFVVEDARKKLPYFQLVARDRFSALAKEAANSV